MLKAILFTISFAVPIILFSQSRWESIVLEGDNWTYLPATSEPPANWNNISFDADTWELGPGGIGYGDADDATIIDPVNSLYLRKIFALSDTSIIENLLIDIDYDDAFVAYVNGTEIARSNNIADESPLFNSAVTDYREALMYDDGLPERHLIDLEVLKEGDNLLAIHIINESTSSSDISARIFLSAKIISDISIFNDTPEWFIEPAEPIVLSTSNLPIIVINTNELDIVDDPKIVAQMGIINNGQNAINSITDAFTDYDGRIKIEIRGESSQQYFPKDSYLFETQDSIGGNNNVSLLGMPKENDWILYAPYSDKSMLRSAVTYELGRLTGNYCTRTAYCELLLNGEYQGIYILLEKIKRDDERVDIGKLDSSETTGNNLTGGYIFRVDKLDEDYKDDSSGWTTSPSPSYPNAKDITYQYFYPKAEDIAPEQQTYLRDLITNTEDVLIGSDFDDPEIGYNKYLNVGSFVDYLLVNELAKEVDNYRYSAYFHKKKDSKGGEIFAGPIWDFNLGYANVDFWDDGVNTEGWVYDGVSDVEWSIMFWWKRLMEDAHFENLVNTRWNYLRQSEFSNENILAIIDSVTTYIDAAQQRNYVRWPILGTKVWPNYDWQGNSYSDEVSFFEDWTLNRLDWMDDNVPGVEIIPEGTIALSQNKSNSDESQIELKLYDDYFNHSILKSKYFTLSDEQSAYTIDTVYYENASEATVVVSHNADLTSVLDMTLTIDNKILNGFQDITTNSMNVLSSQEIRLATANISIHCTKQLITLKCNKPELLPQNVTIYNTFGQVVGNYELEKQAVNCIPVMLKPNIYIARIIMEGTLHTESIIITN